MDANKVKISSNNKRKMPFDTEKVQIKKPVVLMSQINDSFAPIAESTKIVIDNSFKTESNNDEHTKIIKELSLEEIDFEKESFISKENESENISCSENNEVEKTNDMSEYRKKLMNIGITIPLQTNQSDNTIVKNFNAENISISQWSKGDVVLNGKSLEVLFYLCYGSNLNFAIVRLFTF